MDRRSNVRTYLRLRVAVEIPSVRNPVWANLLDISLGGAFIEMPSLLRASAPLIVEFKVPDSRPQNTFRLYARVVRRTPAGIGVAFLNMPTATLHALSAALAQMPQADSGSEPARQFSTVWAV